MLGMNLGGGGGGGGPLEPRPWWSAHCLSFYVEEIEADDLKERRTYVPSDPEAPV